MGATPGGTPRVAPWVVFRAAPGTVFRAAPGALWGTAPGALPRAIPGALYRAIPGRLPRAAPGTLYRRHPGVRAPRCTRRDCHPISRCGNRWLYRSATQMAQIGSATRTPELYPLNTLSRWNSANPGLGRSRVLDCWLWVRTDCQAASSRKPGGTQKDSSAHS
jgi:hypothetical protein